MSLMSLMLSHLVRLFLTAILNDPTHYADWSLLLEDQVQWYDVKSIGELLDT